jgi:shikimate kinase
VTVHLGKDHPKIALTGFMGVGKSSVARHLSQILRCPRIDLDVHIESCQKRKIADIIDLEGLTRYREIESSCLNEVTAELPSGILSLGGGTWTIAENRRVLRENRFTTIWLDSSFDHCWLNISFSRKDRPLARDKAGTLKLFQERQKEYCLADLHFVVRPGLTSFDVAREISELVQGI